MTGYTAGESDRRPWGRWTVLEAGPHYAVKRIEVIPGGRLSLQRHQFRAEQWVVVAGVGTVTLGKRTLEVKPGESVHIDVGEVHRMENRGTAEGVFIEVQTGERLEETDIEGLEDVYGRA